MSFTNPTMRQLFCKVAVDGDQARRWLDALARASGAAPVTDEPLVSVEVVPASPSPSVRGLVPRLTLCAMAEGAARDADALHLLFGGADCVVLFVGGTGDRERARAALEHAPAGAVRLAVRSTSLISGDDAGWESFGATVAGDASTPEGAKQLLGAVVASIVRAKRTALW